MSTDDRERLEALADRVAELERRVAALDRTNPPGGEADPARGAGMAAGPASRAAPMASSQARPVDPPSRVASERPAGWSLVDLEAQLSGRLLAWVGGIALIVGAVFFLSLAFSRGWIGPEARVLIGLGAAATAIGVGGWLFERGFGTPALVLTAVGIGVGMLALYAASREYDFIPPGVALGGSFALAAGAAVIALRADSAAVAALGLVAVVAGPPVFDAPANLFTVLFLGAALTGGVVIALHRSWSWLPGLGFAFSAPQLAFWAADEPSLAVAVTACAAYWVLHAVGAGGETLLRDRARLPLGSAVLLVSNGLFTIAMIEAVLDQAGPLSRSLAFIALAAGHAVIATPPLWRTRATHPFGLLAAGAAIGTLAIGIGLELGGAYQPIAWAALALVIAWYGIERRHREACLAATAVGALALGHLVLVEYPLRDLLRSPFLPDGNVPFASPEAVVLVLLLVVVVVVTALSIRAIRQPGHSTAGWATPARARAIGTASVLGMVAYATPFEFPAPWAVLVWAVLAAGAFAIGALDRTDTDAAVILESVGGGLVAVGVLSTIDVIAPLVRLGVDPGRSTSVVPLLNEGGLALGSVSASLLIAAWLARRSEIRTAAAIGAAALVVYLGSITVVDLFQGRAAIGPAGDEVATQAQVALSIFWVVVGALAFGGGLVGGNLESRLFGLGLLTLATVKVFVFDLAALDVAYRVLSFIGLGLVLLASSFIAVRLRQGPGAAPGPGSD